MNFPGGNNDSDSELVELSAAIRSILAGQTQDTISNGYLGVGTGPVYAEFRKFGRLAAAGWECQESHWKSVCHLLRGLTASTAGSNELLICLGVPPQKVNLARDDEWRQLTANINRGLVGYELRTGGESRAILRVSPLTLVAQNRSLEMILTNFIAQHGLTLAQARNGAIELHQFDMRQFRVDLIQPSKPAERLFRGSRLVPLSEITYQFVQSLERLLADYLVRSVQPDGRMTYLYYPSRGTEDLTRNNSIRQWMATRALIRVWQRFPDNDLLSLLRTNIDYNLRTMYREEDSFGLILDGNKVKLGAVALAALALKESPFSDEYETVCERLQATIETLWREDGQFRTFYQPANRNDCQNFYPGEALLLWSHLLAEPKSHLLLDRFWKSLAFYQRWHLANRNPAFIPWHTQAYYNVWQVTHDARLPPAVFEMNDWLLDVQQWENGPCLDCQGRFYDPKRPFGPPHASSTAVYLEGLADAFELARQLDDTARQERYRIAIVRGLRSIAQLTLKDDTDMFYATKRERLRGGVRTTEYNNVVRIDSVQHSLTAIQKILDALTIKDFEA
jgi:hypothetical protein